MTFAASEGYGWGHLSDGSYANPILAGDYSDPDVIRVGNDYWMITSTFQYSPGMAVLHSADLISWRHVGACVPDMTELGPAYRWDRMERYNVGIYAGSLRHHAGRYWVHFTTLDEGIFVTTAEHPTGPWSPLHRLTDQTGWDDPCPLWDDDGRAWLVASSPGRDHWYTYVMPMSPDGLSIDLEARQAANPWHSSEGNKIYRIDGRYFLLHNEVRGDGNRVLCIMRSDAMTGPWEKRLLLQGVGPDREREPNQGALVDHADGTWSLVTHHGRGGYADGRPISVLPVQWRDGWPTVGSMRWRAEVPVRGVAASGQSPHDDFDGTVLDPRWEWNHEPRPGSWHLADGLVLRSSRPLRQDDLRAIPSMLTRRVLGTSGSTATIRVHTDAFSDGQSAGFGILCQSSSAITVTKKSGRFSLATCGSNSASGPVLGSGPVWLRLRVDESTYLTYEFSLDGESFEPVGNTDTISWESYRGARIALYCTAASDDTGAARFDNFRYYVEDRLRIPLTT